MELHFESGLSKKKGILVPSGVKTVEFPTIATPRIFVDDPTVFPNVARIMDAMLKLVDPKNLLLV